MDIRLKSVHFHASDNLKTYVNEKVGKLFEQNDKIMHADVTLHEEGNDPTNNKYCLIRLSIPGYDHIAEKHAENFEHAISEAVSTLQTIMRNKKTH
jgi:ribosomal subunit interface protein